MKTKRAALYIRVSTRDKQHPENQERDLRAFAVERGWCVAQVYTDHESGASSERTQFKELMAAARARKFDLVLCWSLDRFTREGIGETFEHLTALKRCRVDFCSLKEQHLFQTIEGPAAELLISICAWVADFERRRRIERIHAGLDRARSEGRTLGRRPQAFDLDALRKLRAQGKTLQQIADHVHADKATIWRRLKECRPISPNSSNPSVI